MQHALLLSRAKYQPPKKANRSTDADKPSTGRSRVNANWSNVVKDNRQDNTKHYPHHE